MYFVNAIPCSQYLFYQDNVLSCFLCSVNAFRAVTGLSAVAHYFSIYCTFVVFFSFAVKKKNYVCDGPVHVLMLLLGWRRKSLPSYCGVLTTRSRETVFWQPGCAHTRMTWSSPMRTNCSSCQVRSPLFLFVFQVVSDLDPAIVCSCFMLLSLTCNCFLTPDMACAGQLTGLCSLIRN